MKMLTLNIWFIAVAILSIDVIYYQQVLNAVILVCIINVLLGFEPKVSEEKTTEAYRNRVFPLIIFIALIVSLSIALFVFLERNFNADIIRILVGCLYLVMAIYVYIKGINGLEK